MVDIRFVDFNDAVKKMYNEIYPCIFESKTKIPTDSRSVYQLLGNMRIEKTYALLRPK